MFMCYLLQSSSGGRHRTYVGMTNNFPRRLRQHNGEIKGGARATRANRPWSAVCHVYPFPDKRAAMQFEWKMKRAGRGVNGRLRGVGWLLGGRNDLACTMA